MSNYKHIFGPVPSRRLGVSLGVDLVPMKVCTMNCAYCEVGRTTNLTIERDEYVSYDKVIKELNQYLSTSPNLDYITFSGAGEPTLNSKIGDLIKFIKHKYPQYKIALLTNGSLFTAREVRDECSELDIILPSLDAVSDKVFRKINRPHKKLSNEKIIEGLISLRKEFNKQIWLEVFIAPGVNDSLEELALLKETIIKISPDRIQLNSLDRPGIEDWIKPLSEERAEEIKTCFLPLKIELVGKYRFKQKIKRTSSKVEELIISTIKRRPCTVNDLTELTELTGLKVNEINKYLSGLLEKGFIEQEDKNRGLFLKIKKY